MGFGGKMGFSGVSEGGRGVWVVTKGGGGGSRHATIPQSLRRKEGHEEKRIGAEHAVEAHGHKKVGNREVTVDGHKDGQLLQD